MYTGCSNSIQSPRTGSSGLLLVVLCMVIALGGTGVCLSQPTGPSERVYWEADEQQGEFISSNGEKVTLKGNVRGRQGDVRISCDRAVYNSGTNRATLTGHVRITQPGVVLTAPRVDYNGAASTARFPQGATVTERGATLKAGSGIYYMDDRVAHFNDNVRLTDSSGVLTARRGTYSSIDRVGEFSGDVKVVSDSGRLESDELTYWRTSGKTYARGNVHVRSDADSTDLYCDTLWDTPDVLSRAIGSVMLISESDRATLTGDTLENVSAEEYSVMTGNPRLVRYDSSLVRLDADSASRFTDSLGALQHEIVWRGDTAFRVERDTAIILSDRLERFDDDSSRIVATHNVRMKRGELRAIAGILWFSEAEEVVGLGGIVADAAVEGSSDSVPSPMGSVVGEDSIDSIQESPVLPEESHQPVAGSPTDTLSSESIRAHRLPPPIVWYDSTQLSGDTITVQLSDRKVRTIDVVERAFMIQKSDAEQRFNQLAADRLLFNVDDDTLRDIYAMQRAAALYFFMEEGTPDGANRSSSDTIIVLFADGEVARIGYKPGPGRYEGEMIPEREISGNETKFRLSGFELREPPEFSGSVGSLDTGP